MQKVTLFKNSQQRRPPVVSSLTTPHMGSDQGFPSASKANTIASLGTLWFLMLTCKHLSPSLITQQCSQHLPPAAHSHRTGQPDERQNQKMRNIPLPSPCKHWPGEACYGITAHTQDNQGLPAKIVFSPFLLHLFLFMYELWEAGTLPAAGRKQKLCFSMGKVWVVTRNSGKKRQKESLQSRSEPSYKQCKGQEVQVW